MNIVNDRLPAVMFYFTRTERFSNELAQRGYWLSSPSLFNDPLDCDFRVLRNYLRSLTPKDQENLRIQCINENNLDRRDKGARLLRKKLDEGHTFGVGPHSTYAN